MDMRRDRLERETHETHAAVDLLEDQIWCEYMETRGLETVDQIVGAGDRFVQLGDMCDSLWACRRNEARAGKRLESFRRRMPMIERALDAMRRGGACVFGDGRDATVDRLFCPEHADAWCHECGAHAVSTRGGLFYCAEHAGA